MFKASQLVMFSIALTLFSSGAAHAQAFSANGLTINLTAPTNLCAQGQSTQFAYTVGGTFTTGLSAPGEATVKLFANPLVIGETNFVCPESSLPATKYEIGSYAYPFIGSPQPNTPYTVSVNQTDFVTTVIGVELFNEICATNQTKTYGLCLYVVDTSVQTNNFRKSSVQPTLINSAGSSDSTNANISITSYVAGDQRIEFGISSTGSFSSFEVCYTEGEATTDFAGNTCSGTLVAISGSVSGSSDSAATTVLYWDKDANGERLKNGIKYSFKVRGANANNFSNVVVATPQAGFSTLALYGGSNGGLSWQCTQSTNSSPGAALSLLLLFLALFFISKSRRQKFLKGTSRLIAMTAILVFATPAVSEINFGVGGSPYLPHLDRNIEGTKVYECLFGDATLPLLGMGVDFHVFDPFGSFQLGFGLAYSWASGTALTDPPTPVENACGGKVPLPGASVGFHTLQLRPRFTYVFDPYIDYFPFVPYVRAGLVGAGYYFTYQGAPDAGGQPNGNNPMGIKFGWEAGGGLMFLLDTLEPTVASRARANGVYNHIYLVADVAYSSINDFGSAGYDLSPKGVLGSVVPLLFTFSLVLETP